MERKSKGQFALLQEKGSIGCIINGVGSIFAESPASLAVGLLVAISLHAQPQASFLPQAHKCGIGKTALNLLVFSRSIVEVVKAQCTVKLVQGHSYT